jgi:hypothetical protein
MAEAYRLSSIHTFGAQVLSTVFPQLRQGALLFQDFRPFSTIVFLRTAVLKHDLAVSSRVVVHVVLFLELTHSPILQFLTTFQIQRQALM